MGETTIKPIYVASLFTANWIIRTISSKYQAVKRDATEIVNIIGVTKHFVKGFYQYSNKMRLATLARS